MKTTARIAALGALCLTLTVPAFNERARANQSKADTVAQPMARTLIDRDANRSMEIVTDRHESVAQFFQRQKLALAIAPILDGKPISNTDLANLKTTTKIFVSYPLENDHDLIIRLYGANFSLAPVSAEVQALFNGNDDVPPKTQTMLIFAPTDTTKIEDNTAAVRLVGRVRIFEGGSWLPESEIAALAYLPPKDKP